MLYIEIDEEVYSKLQKVSEPFVDTPNTTIRRVLGLKPRKGKASAMRGPNLSESVVSKKARTRSHNRLAPGSLLPAQAYYLPILASLLKRGGVASSGDVQMDVLADLEGRLNDLDRGKLASGVLRWRNRAQIARMEMIKAGYMKSNSTRGVWEISESGKQWLKEK